VWCIRDELARNSAETYRPRRGEITALVVGANGGDWEVEVQDLNRYVLVLQQVDSLSAGRKNSQGCEAEAGIREFSASALVAGMSNRIVVRNCRRP